MVPPTGTAGPGEGTAASPPDPPPPIPPVHDNTTLNPVGTEQLEGDDWELRDWDLPKGFILSGSKFLLEDPRRQDLLQ